MQNQNPQGFFEPPAGGSVCPRCRVALQMFDRQGITLDFCPQCQGVWMDRGELDKLIQRSVQMSPPQPPPMQAPPVAYQQPVAYQAPPQVVYQQPVAHHSGGWLGEILGIGHHEPPAHHEPPHHYDPHRSRHHD